MPVKQSETLTLLPGNDYIGLWKGERCLMMYHGNIPRALTEVAKAYDIPFEVIDAETDEVPWDRFEHGTPSLQFVKNAIADVKRTQLRQARDQKLAELNELEQELGRLPEEAE